MENSSDLHEDDSTQCFSVWKTKASKFSPSLHHQGAAFPQSLSIWIRPTSSFPLPTHPIMLWEREYQQLYKNLNKFDTFRWLTDFDEKIQEGRRSEVKGLETILLVLSSTHRTLQNQHLPWRRNMLTSVLQRRQEWRRNTRKIQRGGVCSGMKVGWRTTENERNSRGTGRDEVLFGTDPSEDQMLMFWKQRGWWEKDAEVERRGCGWMETDDSLWRPLQGAERQKTVKSRLSGPNVSPGPASRGDRVLYLFDTSDQRTDELFRTSDELQKTFISR